MISYNSRGFCQIKQNFCQLLVSICGNNIPILCNQENFLLRSNSYVIRKCLPDFHIIVKPAIKLDLTHGRPINGMFVAIPNIFKERAKDVSPNNHRVQAILLNLNTQVILILNTYFPTDSRNNIDIQDIQDTIEAVDSVIKNNDFSRVIITGDINCNFLKNTAHVNYVNNFLDTNSFVKSWENFLVDFTHVHESNGITSTASLDHFFWSQSFHNEVKDAGVIHHIDNKSDHEPIYCVIKMSDQIETKTSQSENSLPNPKPSWNKSSPEQKEGFKASLQTSLEKLQIPQNASNCSDSSCKEAHHSEDTDNFVVETLQAVEKAAEICIPVCNLPQGRKKKNTPGWNSQVKPFRENAGFWFSVWKSAGRPINTELHKIMKRTRNLYHYQLKKCQKSENLIKKNNFLDACLNGSADIFTEIKKLRGSSRVVANSIDGKTENIEEHFAGIYKNLYNSVNEKDDIEKLYKEVEKKIDIKAKADVEKVTPAVVKEAVSRLNNNKTDPVLSFTSDFLKNSPDILFSYLSIIIKSFIIHAHTSHVLLLATLVPLLKDKMGDICSSKNFRSIAIISPILKIIDRVIILLFGECLKLDDIQFSWMFNCYMYLACH